MFNILKNRMTKLTGCQSLFLRKLGAGAPKKQQAASRGQGGAVLGLLMAGEKTYILGMNPVVALNCKKSPIWLSGARPAAPHCRTVEFTPGEFQESPGKTVYPVDLTVFCACEVGPFCNNGVKAEGVKRG